jgi:CheY-like chemotaxis protein
VNTRKQSNPADVCMLVVSEHEERQRATCDALGATGFRALGVPSFDGIEPLLETAAAVLLDVSEPLLPQGLNARHARLRELVAGRCHVILYGERTHGGQPIEGGTSLCIPWTADGRTLVAFVRRLLLADGAVAVAPTEGINARPTRMPSRPDLEVSQRKRLVIIDESEMTLDLIQARLTGAGFDVRIAMSFVELAPIVESFKPDVLVASVKRQGMAPAEVAASLRTIAGDAALLLSSSIPDEQLSQLAVDSGADGWVSKRHGLERFAEQLASQAEALAALRASRSGQERRRERSR